MPHRAARRAAWSWLTESDRTKAQSIVDWLEGDGQLRVRPSWIAELERMLAASVKAEIESVHDMDAALDGTPRGLAPWVWARLADRDRWL